MFSTGDKRDRPHEPPRVPLRPVRDGWSEGLRADEQYAWRTFVEGTQALLLHLDRELSNDVDLGLGEFMILESLAEHPMLRMTDLAGCGMASRSTVSRQVSRLVEIGDVERIPDTTDARNRLVRITDVGREHLRRASVGHAARIRHHLLDRVDSRPGCLDELGDFFRAVRDGLE